MTPTMTIQTGYFQPDVVRVDVVAGGLPANFLGTAFDLTFEGNWRFDHDELCGFFDQEDGHILQLVSSQPQNHRVVFGLAVASGEYSKPSDGCVASFYFHVQELKTGKISFENARISVYQNGRRDMPDVQWEGGFINLPLYSKAPQVTQEMTLTQQTVKTLQADLFRSLADPSLVNVYGVLLITLALALAVFLGILAYFRFRRKK